MKELLLSIVPHLDKNKDAVFSIIGAVAAMFTSAMGGWDKGLQALMIFIVIDYISGVIVAAVFQKSTKTENGGLASEIGWKGIAKKVMTLVIILIAHELDVILGMRYFRDASVFMFLANELLSIIENAGLMGLKLPPAIEKAVDILNSKVDDNK